MEQKTEASQAVDDLDALASRLSRIHDACLDNRPKQAVGEMICAAQNMPEWNRVRAALKAQLAPASNAAPAKYEQRFISPNGAAAPWHDASAETFQRYQGSGDIGEGWRHQVRALYDRPAPAEEQSDGLSPVYAWLERSTRNTPAEVANAARTMMAFYQGAEFPAAQGEDSARLDAERYQWLCDEYGITWLPCFLEHHLSCGYVADGKESVDDTIDRARASAETGGVKP